MTEAAKTEGTDLAARLAAAKARRAAIAADLAARRAGDIESQVAREEAAAEDEAALADIESRRGEPGVKWDYLRTLNGRVIALEAPDPVIFRKFQDRAEPAKTNDLERLVAPTVIYPSKDEFFRYIGDMPGTLTHAFELCAKLAGVRQGEISGK